MAEDFAFWEEVGCTVPAAPLHAALPVGRIAQW